MGNKWKTIDGFDKYMVSCDGKVLSYQHKKTIILKPQHDSMGYVHYRLYNEQGIKLFKGHRLVLETFTDKIEGKTVINHINGVKDDNRLENLEWCSQSENMKHYHKLKKERNE